MNYESLCLQTFNEYFPIKWSWYLSSRDWAKLVKYLLNKKKDLSSNLQPPCKSQVWWWYEPVVPVLESSSESLQGLLPRQPHQIYEFHLQWESLSWEKEKRKGRRRKEGRESRGLLKKTHVNFWPPHVRAHKCICTAHMCTQTKTTHTQIMELISDKQPYKRSTR